MCIRDRLFEGIRFRKVYAEPLTMRIVDRGTKHEVYERAQGRIGLLPTDVSECIFLTKYIGNYNITKIGTTFVFENEGWAVAMERI